MTLTYGFMESPNLPEALALCRKQGLTFDIMATSLLPRPPHGGAGRARRWPIWQDRLFIFLTKNATNPTDFYHIPPGRVVEMGRR